MIKVRFFKLHEKVISPTQGYPTDACWDVYYCPKDDSVVDIMALEGKVLSTGIKVEIPEGYYLEVKDRSGMAAKKGLKIGAKVIDRMYDGELLINLHNITGAWKVEIKPGDKIAQVALVPKPEWQFEESLVDDLNKETDRGSNGFGSTGF